MAEIISITINKGGVGKTSLVSNLVGALIKKHDKKVLIVDTDGQGNLGIAFGLVPDSLETSVYDVLLNKCDTKEAIIEINENLHIIPANNDMSFVEFDVLPNLKEFNQPFHLLKNALESVKDYYDYIFIDTPPAMGLIAGNVLVASDKVIIPYVPEVFAVNGLIRIYDAITDFKNDHNPKLEILGIIGMMVDLRTTLHQSMLQQARAHCYENNLHMYETIIPRSIRFASSTLQGEPATWTNKNNHLVSAYYEFLDEMIERGDLHV